MSEGPIAPEVVPDGLGGYMCAKAQCSVYLVKVERGPRIGVRLTWRHVERHPACERLTSAAYEEAFRE